MTYLIEATVLGLVLCADSFSAALALGAREHNKRDAFKLALCSGLAEGLVSLIGALAGVSLIAQIDFLDHWISFFLLILVASHMAFEGIEQLKAGEDPIEEKEFHSFTKILIVSFATSLDAFAVGVSLGVSDKPLSIYVISIGLWAFVSTLIAMAIAKRASRRLGPVFNIIGAFILLALAVKFLVAGI